MTRISPGGKLPNGQGAATDAVGREQPARDAIEPKPTALQTLSNAAFDEAPTAACDWRANPLASM
jgi:hypothetical protein